MSGMVPASSGILVWEGIREGVAMSLQGRVKVRRGFPEGRVRENS